MWRGIAYLVRATLIYALLLAALWYTDQPLALLLLWPLAGLAISGLFVLAHDAAHDALFESRALNQLMARLALLPTLHAAAVWTLGHNRIHHVHTNRVDYDFVWHPLSPVQFAELTPWQKLNHRFEWSTAGMGWYYLRRIWWERMMRFPAPGRFAPLFRADRIVVVLYATLWSLCLAGLGYRHGGTVSAVWTWCKLGLMPWLLWNYFIAATVFVQHTAPRAPWLRGDEWKRNRGQLESSTNYLVPGWYNLFAHNIYLHLPHHIDARIPFYNLPAALAALRRTYPHLVRVSRLGWRHFLHLQRHCKLYDFERGAWLDYRDAAAVLVTTPPASATATNGAATAA